MDSPDLETVTRMETLLQFLLEETISEDEAAELSAIWQRYPETLRVGTQAFFSEQLLRFRHDLTTKITSSQLDTLYELARMNLDLDQEPGDANNAAYGLSWKNCSAENLDMDELARLASESPALPIQENVSTSYSSSSRYENVKPFDRNAVRPLISLKLLAPLLLCVLGLVVYFEFRPVPPPEESDLFGLFPARITEAIDADFEEGVLPFKKHQRLEPGPIELLSGLLEIEYKNGVRVVLEGPATYHVETPLESACDLGRLSVYVPPEGKGFSVMTPTMTVRDLGTTFVLNVDLEKSDLHVLEGLVQTKWVGSKEWFDYPNGRGVSVNQAAIPKNIVADKSIFVSTNRLDDLSRVFYAKQKTKQQERQDREKNDPHLLLRLDLNAKSHRQRIRLIEGPLPGEQAALFRTGSDIIKASASGAARQLTFTATVRLDGLRRACNTILATDGFLDHPGFCWSIDERGRLQLKLLDRMGGTPVPYDSDAVMLPNRFHTWVHLAVTIDMDRKEIAHFLDGKRIATVPIRDDFTVPLHDLSVGNWLRSVRTPAGRQFEGGIASIDVFSRILTPREIQERCLK